MTWQQRIINKYNLSENSVKIISDDTGILLHPSFLKFLSEMKKKWVIAKTIPDILTNQNKDDLVILCNKLKIPSFISNKTDTFYFRYSDIPFNGDTSVLSKFSTKDIIDILDYTQDKDPHFVFTEHALKPMDKKAKEYASEKRLANLQLSIHTILSGELTIENIFSLSQKWAELQYLSYRLNDTDFLNLIELIDNYTNPYFESGKWQEAFYASPSDPQTMDKIVHNIKKDTAKKKALLCFDCMGLPEWLLLKQFLSGLNLSYQENQVFALLPSITAFSRSAIFAGTYNVYEKANPGQATEEKDFKAVFGNSNTLYLREKDFTNSDVLLGYNTVSVLFNFFDDLSHAAVLQKNNLTKFSYYNSVLDYLKNSRIEQIFKDLKDQGFAIYICSDHGSTIACGNGKRIDKYLQDTFAKRATLIPVDSAELTDFKKVKIPFIDDKLVVLPEGREIFANKGQCEINHGGITIEEMVVPYIKIID